MSQYHGNRKHGMSNTKIYGVWSGIIYRCENKNCHDYKWYGARGIRMCNEWRNDFIIFYAWALHNGYKEGLTIDRINGDLGYCPDNCRWIPQSEQHETQKKKHNEIFVTYENTVYTLADYCRQYGFKRDTILKRLKRGLLFEEAINIPIKHGGKRT
jgi:hypothetical protein